MIVKCPKCDSESIAPCLPYVNLEQETFVYPFHCGECLTYTEVCGKLEIALSLSGE
jgi:transcription elongation factor Elf1